MGRETIRPEVCRTFNFGEKGASEGQWYKTHLANVKLASEKVDWGNEDLSYLDADAYERAVAEAVDAATPARDPSQITRAEITNPKGVFKVLYKDEAEFRRLAAKFHVFPEWKDGVPERRVPRRRAPQDERRSARGHAGSERRREGDEDVRGVPSERRRRKGGGIRVVVIELS